MTCQVCDLWLEENHEGDCPSCGQDPGCGDSDCSWHEGHCLLDEPRYRPDICDFCVTEWGPREDA